MKVSGKKQELISRLLSSSLPSSSSAAAAASFFKSKIKNNKKNKNKNKNSKKRKHGSETQTTPLSRGGGNNQGSSFLERTRIHYRSLQTSSGRVEHERYGILPVGTKIILKGLINKSELNGNYGEILEV